MSWCEGKMFVLINRTNKRDGSMKKNKLDSGCEQKIKRIFENPFMQGLSKK